MTFLADRDDARDLADPAIAGIRAEALFLGAGDPAAEIAHYSAARHPSTAELRQLHDRRLNRRAVPVLIIATHGRNRAALATRFGDDWFVRDDVDRSQAADPATLQPSIRPLFRQAAKHLRTHRPPEMSQIQQSALIESLEAPRSMRDERALRKLFQPGRQDGEQLSREIARFVKERGFQPWRPPKPLPPIQADDVNVVLWMAVFPE